MCWPFLSKFPHPTMQNCFYDPKQYPYIYSIFGLKSLTFVTKPYILIIFLTTFYSIYENYRYIIHLFPLPYSIYIYIFTNPYSWYIYIYTYLYSSYYSSSYIIYRWYPNPLSLNPTYSMHFYAMTILHLSTIHLRPVAKLNAPMTTSPARQTEETPNNFKIGWLT